MTIQHTPNYNLPYPQGADPADGPAQIGGLATATESALNGFDTRMDASEATVSTNSKHPRARMRAADAQVIPSSDWAGGTITHHQIDLTDVIEDYHRGGTAICDEANNRLVIPETGVWMISGLQCINNVLAEGGFLISQVRVGTTAVVHSQLPLYNSSNYIPGHRMWRCTAGQFITMWASTNVAGVQTVRSATAQVPNLEITFIGVTP